MTIPPQQEGIKAKCFHPTGLFVEFAKEDVETSIPQRFQKIVQRYPHRLALHTEHPAWSYLELNEWADRLSGVSLTKRPQANEPAVLLLEQSIFLVGAILATLK